MSSFFLALNVVLPLCLWMAVGYGTRRIFELDGSFISKANVVLFRIFLPLLLFKNMLDSDIASEFSSAIPLVVFLIMAVVTTFAVLMLFVPRIVKEDARRGVIVQGIMRSNTALYGIPVALSVYGEGNIGVIVLLVAVCVSLFNIFSVSALEIFRGGQLKIGSLLLKIITNPLILGILAGIVFNLLGIVLPSFLSTAVSGFSGIATPFSFFLLGAGFSFAAAAKNRKTLIGVILSRLVVVPLIWVGVALLLGFRELSLLGVLVIAAPPTAVSSYTMASAMGADAQLANEIVVFTSVFSVISMFLWIFTLRSLGLI